MTNALEGEWIEVPAHRIYLVDNASFQLNFEHVGDADYAHSWKQSVFRRKRDGKLFKRSLFTTSTQAQDSLRGPFHALVEI